MITFIVRENKQHEPPQPVSLVAKEARFFYQKKKQICECHAISNHLKKTVALQWITSLHWFGGLEIALHNIYVISRPPVLEFLQKIHYYQVTWGLQSILVLPCLVAVLASSLD